MIDLLSILGLALVCGAWIALQRWIARLDPDVPGIKRSCSGCQVPGTAAEDCAACHELPGAPQGS